MNTPYDILRRFKERLKRHDDLRLVGAPPVPRQVVMGIEFATDQAANEALRRVSEVSDAMKSEMARTMQKGSALYRDEDGAILFQSAFGQMTFLMDDPRYEEATKLFPWGWKR